MQDGNTGSLENPFIIPFLMNCRKDNPELISSWMPYSIQETGTFIMDLDSLGNRKDVFCDDNGAWTMKGNREELYCVTKNLEGEVSLLRKVSSEADISVRSPALNFTRPLLPLNTENQLRDDFLWH